jgi:DnaK suppressor protein
MAVKKKAKKRPAPAAKKKTVKKAPPGKAASKKKSVAKPAGKAAVKKKRAALSPLSSEKRKDQLRRILLKKRNDVVQGIEEQLGRKLSLTPGQSVDSVMDSADLSSQDMDRGVDFSLMEMKYEQYKDIADAFRKLENDSFGLCEECGQEIDIKRLQVNPLARYCIECKTRMEQLQQVEREETRFKE